MAWFECMSHYVIVHTGGVHTFTCQWDVWYPCMNVTQCFGTNAYVTHDGMVSMHAKLHMTWHSACNTMEYNAVINVAR